MLSDWAATDECWPPASTAVSGHKWRINGDPSLGLWCCSVWMCPSSFLRSRDNTFSIMSVIEAAMQSLGAGWSSLPSGRIFKNGRLLSNFSQFLAVTKQAPHCQSEHLGHYKQTVVVEWYLCNSLQMNGFSCMEPCCCIFFQVGKLMRSLGAALWVFGQI